MTFELQPFQVGPHHQPWRSTPLSPASSTPNVGDGERKAARRGRGDPRLALFETPYGDVGRGITDILAWYVQDWRQGATAGSPDGVSG